MWNTEEPLVKADGKNYFLGRGETRSRPPGPLAQYRALSTPVRHLATRILKDRPFKKTGEIRGDGHVVQSLRKERMVILIVRRLGRHIPESARDLYLS